MKSILKATAILGSSSMINVLIGLVSAKIWAVWVGPLGVGYISILQSVLGLGIMISGMGVATAIVRIGAQAIAEEDKRKLSANLKAAFLMTAFLGGVAIVLIVLFRLRLSILIFGNEEQNSSIVLLSVALFFNLQTNLILSVYNAYHRVSSLATIAVLNNLVNACAIIFCIYLWHIQGIALGMLSGAVFNCFINFILFKRDIIQPSIGISLNEIKNAIFSLLKFGVPYTASMIVGTGIQLTLPILIVNWLGVESAGLYRAAASISTMSLSVVLTSMAQDYYPRLSSVANDNEKMCYMVNQQQWLSLLILSPIFLGLLVLSPILIKILYSSEFQTSQIVFKWIVVGDLFKSFGWVLAFVILARSKSSLYFFCEFIGGFTALIAVSVAMSQFGLEGAGIGYMISYIIYFGTALFLVKRQIGFKYTNNNKMMLGGTIAAVFIANILLFFDLFYWWYVFLFITTIAAVVLSITILIREIGVETLIHKAKFWQR